MSIYSLFFSFFPQRSPLCRCKRTFCVWIIVYIPVHLIYIFIDKGERRHLHFYNSSYTTPFGVQSMPSWDPLCCMFFSVCFYMAVNEQCAAYALHRFWGKKVSTNVNSLKKNVSDSTGQFLLNYESISFFHSTALWNLLSCQRASFSITLKISIMLEIVKKTYSFSKKL